MTALKERNMTTSKGSPPLPRPSTTTWGDEFRAAYNQAKRHFKAGVITYEAVAERVSQLVPVSHTSILRLGYLETPPEKDAPRQMAYLALVAMGYDPRDFGLQSTDRALRGMTDIEIRKLLDPGMARNNGKH